MKARYIGASDEQVKWGNNDDPRGLLVEGNVYEVECEEIHEWHTKYSLRGIKGAFNSVCFERVVPFRTHEEYHKEAMKSLSYRFWWYLLWPYYKLWLPFTIWLRKALGGE